MHCKRGGQRQNRQGGLDPIIFVLHEASNRGLRWPGLMGTDTRENILYTRLWNKEETRRPGFRLSSAAGYLCDQEEVAYLGPKSQLRRNG